MLGNNILKKSLALSLCGGMVLQLAACGVILYPERKGQVDGKIDPAVALLDAVGLLFFIVPGVIAFAVDFATGAIYLPPGGKSALSQAELDGLSKDGKVDIEQVNILLNKKISNPVALNETNVQITRASSLRELQAMLAYQRIYLASH